MNDDHAALGQMPSLEATTVSSPWLASSDGSSLKPFGSWTSGGGAGVPVLTVAGESGVKPLGTGIYFTAAPVLRSARIAATACSERPESNTTHCPGPAPCSTSKCANRFAASSSSR